MGRPRKSLDKKTYPEVFSVYQALGALTVRLLSARWGDRRSTQIFEFLFQEKADLAGATKPGGCDGTTGWEKTWRNWGAVGATTNPFLGNNPTRVGEVLDWGVQQMLLKKSEACDLSQMFATLVEWESWTESHPEDMYSRVVFIVDSAAMLANLQLMDSHPGTGAYLDEITGDVFEFKTLRLLNKGTLGIREKPYKAVLDAAVHLLKVGELLVDLVPQLHEADAENFEDKQLPKSRKSVGMALLIQEGESLLERTYIKGKGVAARELISRLRQKLKELEQ